MIFSHYHSFKKFVNKLFINDRKFYIILFLILELVFIVFFLLLDYLITNNYIAYTMYQVLYKIEAFNTLSQVECPENHVPRWRLRYKILLTECSWVQHLLKGGERCRIEQRETPSYESVLIKNSANPRETLELALQRGLKLG